MTNALRWTSLIKPLPNILLNELSASAFNFDPIKIDVNENDDDDDVIRNSNAGSAFFVAASVEQQQQQQQKSKNQKSSTKTLQSKVENHIGIPTPGHHV